MSKSKAKKEKKKRGFFARLFGTIFMLLVVIILAVGGLAAYLLISMNKDPVVTRTLQDYKDTQADTAFSHLSFTEDGQMTQSYSEDDVGWFVGTFMHKEGIDDIEELMDEIPVPDFQLKGFKLELEPGEAAVCAEGSWRDIRLVGRALLDISVEEGTVSVALKAFRVGKITVPVSLIDRLAKTDIGEQTVSFAPQPLFISEIKAVTPGEGSIDVTGPMITEIFGYDQLSENRLKVARLAQEKYWYAASVMDTDSDDPAVRYSAILPVLMEDPEEYVGFLDQLFTLTSAVATRKIGLGQKNFGIAQRWFPDYYEFGYDELRREAYRQYSTCERFIKNISERITNDWLTGKLKAGADGFTYGGKPLEFREYFGKSYALYRPFLALDEGRMCTFRDDPNTKQLPAILLRGKDGIGYVLTVHGAGSYSILPLKEEVYQEYMASGTVPEVVLVFSDQFLTP